MAHVRNAVKEDVSRIAEILVFSKRTHYRRIFQDDDFSFGVLQVLSVAEELLKTPQPAFRVYRPYEQLSLFSL